MNMESGYLTPHDVRRMFDRIAPVYDFMNRAMTATLDRRWRRLTAEAVVRPGDRVLDACCGTGDLALACARAGAGAVVGLDFSERMLERARRKAQVTDCYLEWITGDLLALPFDEESFDAATVGFGIRNVADVHRAFAELRRVLRPGAQLGILEITRPSGALAPFYRLWFDRLIPLAGKLLRAGAAYTYLPASVRRFPGPDELSNSLLQGGFERVQYRLFAGGIVALHVASTPHGAAR
jgi:demethylmenaquinone methyltransferase/2-methoxy-6-polyprenyl-1,4-benzoquinol methylase